MPPKCTVCGQHYWKDHPCECGKVPENQETQQPDGRTARDYYEEWLSDGGRESVLALAQRCFDAGRQHKREIIDLEELAHLEHEQWMEWAKAIIADTSSTISRERAERWKKYMVPYSELPEEVKEHDRKWARKIIEVIRRRGSDD